MATAALARAFSTKAVAAVLSATALCGVAVAAGTGNLPSPLGRGAEPGRPLANGGATGPSSPSAHGPGSATPGGSPRPLNGPSAGGSGGGAQGPGPSASPTPGTPSATGRATPPLSAELAALCRTFGDRTDKGEHPRQLVLDPVFAQLVEAAGGPDKVEGYCGEALGRAGDDARRSAAPQPTHDDRQGSASGGGNTAGSGAGADGGKGNGNGDGATGRTGGSGGNANSGGNAGGNANSGGNANGGGARPGRTGPTLPASPALPDVRPSGQDRQAAQE